MSSIGVMAMPADFRYREVFLKGKPQHDRFDLFRVRHPSMDVGRRAKIFSPFDALKGFNEAIASKDVLYRDRIELSEDDRKELDRRLQILKGLTYNGRMARANRIKITVVYYVPCSDENNEAFGLRGRYRKLTGICWNVDELYGSILVDNTRISFEDICMYLTHMAMTREGYLFCHCEALATRQSFAAGLYAVGCSCACGLSRPLLWMAQI